MKCSICGHKMKEVRRDHHYAECGLDQVWLIGVSQFECPQGHTDVLIPDPVGLHRLIALKLIARSLSGKGVRFLRKEMGLTTQVFADLVNVDRTTVSRWENGLEPIGKSSDALIRLIFLRAMEEKSQAFCKEVTLDDLRRMEGPVGKLYIAT